jgi:hypothetical protein
MNLAGNAYEGPMQSPSGAALDALWSRHHAAWRDQAQIITHWQEANETDPELLRYKVLTTSYFSASAAKLSARRPGHRNFPVNKRGVIFSGTTREPIAGGVDAAAFGPALRGARLGRQQRVRRTGFRRSRTLRAGLAPARLDAWFMFL